MMALAEREAAPKQALRAWGAPVALAMMAIVVTHHLTSYATAGAAGRPLARLLVRCAAAGARRTPGRSPSSAILLAVFWLFVVASSTVGYLSPRPRRRLRRDRQHDRRRRRARAASSRAAAPASRRPRSAARAVALLAVRRCCWPGCPSACGRVWRRYRTRAVRAALRGRRRRLLRHPRPAPGPGRLGDRQPGQRVPLRRPRLRPRLRLRRGAAALAASTADAAADRRRVRPRPGRRRDLRLALGLAAGAAAAGRGRRRDDLLAAAGMAEWAREQLPGRALRRRTADANLLLVPGGKTVADRSSPDVEDVLRRRQRWPAGWCRCCAATDSATSSSTAARSAADGLRGYYFSPPRPPTKQLLPPSVVDQVRRRPRRRPRLHQRRRSRSSTWGRADEGPRRPRGSPWQRPSLCALLALALPFEPLQPAAWRRRWPSSCPATRSPPRPSPARRIERPPVPRLQPRPQPRRARPRRPRAQLPAGRDPRRVLGAAALPRRPRLPARAAALRRPRGARGAGSPGRCPASTPPGRPARRGRPGGRRRGGPRLHPARGHQRDRLHRALDPALRDQADTGVRVGVGSAERERLLLPPAWSSFGDSREATRPRSSSIRDRREVLALGPTSAAAASADRVPVTATLYKDDSPTPDRPFRRVSTWLGPGGLGMSAGADARGRHRRSTTTTTVASSPDAIESACAPDPRRGHA